MHSNKFCHRDLKPENIYLLNNEIKIGDFGTAKDLDFDDTGKATMIGTTPYMSPELLS